MRSFNEVKSEFKKKYAEARALESALKTNPTLANSAQMKRRYRGVGTLVLVLGLGITAANYLSYQATGRMLILAIAVNIVCVFGGLWMILTGKNPFLRHR